MQNQQFNNHQQDLDNKPLTQFYNSLAHYSPLCPRSNKSNVSQSLSQNDEQREQYYQTFLLNSGWWKSLICIVLMNALFIVTYLKFILDTRVVYVQNNSPSQPAIATLAKSNNYNVMKILCIVSLGLMNISYLLTQFLNPGVRDLSQIPQQQLSSALKVDFCQKCNQYKPNTFVHCFDCEVCIWNYDHHCGFFSKCIGGKAQLCSFYSFLITVTLVFMILLACMCIQLGNL